MFRTNWRYIDEDRVSASYGLAADEFLMKSQDSSSQFPASLRLYTYHNYCALCGRFQDITAEIDLDSCKTHDVEFGRRLTGGGAIIMGEEQLGICLATHSSVFEFQHIRELYKLFSQPVINALSSLGINAGFRAKNDLEVNGRKIAGLGIHIDETGGLQFHCSLLLDLDINEMLKVLNIPIQKYSDRRMIKAIEQRITTIHKETGSDLSMTKLKEIVANAYADSFNIDYVIHPVQEDELRVIQKIEEERYQSDEWIFQRSPQQDMTGMSLVKTPAGLLRTYVGLKGENIKSVLITGDFFDPGDTFNKIESELKWSLLEREKIQKVVEKYMNGDVQSNGVDQESIVNAIWTAAQRALAANRYTYKGSCYYPKKETSSKILNENV